MSASSFRRLKWLLVLVVVLVTGASAIRAGDADLAIPDLHAGHFFGTPGDPHSGISAWNLLAGGALVICITLGFSLYLRAQIHALPAHKSMLDVAEVIFQTCKTYLIQQGKFLLMLFVLIAIAISYYLLGFGGEPESEGAAHSAGIGPLGTVGLVLLFSIIGMGGSYAVAWYGIRVNTYANARTAFASP